MEIRCLTVGSFGTNCYVLSADRSANECLVVDAGLDGDELAEVLCGQGLTAAALVLTHGHADHIGGVEGLRRAFPQIRLYVHPLDACMLVDAEQNLSSLAGTDLAVGPADVSVADGDVIEAAGVRLEVIHTPGHTPGGISLSNRAEGVVFTGDALFAESVGRTDFPGGDHQQLVAGIRRRLMVLPEQTRVYPGHGPSTTIGWEKCHNPFLM